MEDRKFCTACQLMKSTEGGIMKTGKIKRWVCLHCHKKMSLSPYARKKDDEMRHLRFSH